MPSPTDTDQTLLASELRVVLGQLVRRMRAERQPLPLLQTSVLSRLERGGPHSASELAAAERMRPQSMAQMLAQLQEQGLIARAPDPRDGRRALVTLDRRRDRNVDRMSPSARRLAGRRAQRPQPARALETLTRALPLLRRLAES